MKLSKISLLSTAFAAAMGFGANANAYVVDMFSSPSASYEQLVENLINGDNTYTLAQIQAMTNYARDSSANASSVADQWGTDFNTIIGGYRDLVANKDGGGVGGVTAQVVDGQFKFSSDAGVLGSAKIQWDGNDAATPGSLAYGLNANLVHQTGCPVEGCNAFSAIVLDADHGFEYQIGVYTSATQYTVLTTGSIFEVDSLSGDLPYVSTYLFKWFTDFAAGYHFDDGLPFYIQHGVGGAADMQNVGAIELVVNSNSGLFGPGNPFAPGFTPTQKARLDLNIDSVTKVPEPATLALLGIGLLSAGFASRRK